MEAIPVTIGEAELAERLARSRHTRFPVYDGDLDHIVGALHLKDFIRWRMDAERRFELRTLLRPARMVPEHMPVEKLLETFKRERGHMAVVLDEYGGTAGLVTLEDLIEEVVGEVRDEFDVETAPLRVLGPGQLEVAGELQLVDLAEHMALGDELPDVDTVGGLILTVLGRPAVVGETVTVGGVSFAVLGVTGLAIDRVRVSAADSEPDGGGDPAR
jgi:CBS domain containing-hemolysin-like protein